MKTVMYHSQNGGLLKMIRRTDPSDFGLRQLSRLTGVSFGVIQKIMRHGKNDQ